MVVTGAGPGIMAAGHRGRRPRAAVIGVNIRLPFEQAPNEIIAGDPKLVSMKYFFTRKLMLVKESDGFVVAARRLRHARRDLRAADPAADRQGRARRRSCCSTSRAARYWRGAAQRFVARRRRPPRPRRPRRPRPGAASPTTSTRPSTRSSASAATTTRSAGSAPAGRSACGPRRPTTSSPTSNERFGDLLLEGAIERTDPLPAEVADDDHLDLPRLVMAFNPWQVGEPAPPDPRAATTCRRAAVNV